MITTESLARLLALCLLARLVLSHSYSTILARMLVFHPAFHLVFLRSSPMMPDHSLACSLVSSLSRWSARLLARLVVCLLAHYSVYLRLHPADIFWIEKSKPRMDYGFFFTFLTFV